MLPYFKDGVSVGNMPFATFDEISGMTRSQKASNYPCFWCIDDGLISPPIMFAMNSTNAANSGTWTLVGAAGGDIEDIASATVTGQPFIYISDIGDNAAARTTVSIFRIKEPTIGPGTGGSLASGTDYERIVCQYPAAPTGEQGTARRDAESFIVDPSNGDMYVITKRTSVPQVFKLPHQTAYTGTQTFTYMGLTYPLSYSVPVIGTTAAGYATAADISPDGTEILVRNYTDVYLFSRESGTIEAALSGTPTNIPAFVGGGTISSHPNNEPQGEAIVYDWTGTNFYTASEGVAAFGSSTTGYPLFMYERVTSVPSSVSFQDGSGGYTGVMDTYIWTIATGQSANRGSETTFVVDWNVSTTDERYGLIKFDLSSIPSDAVIIGDDLKLYIEVEGARFRVHRMLESWDESTTYTSLGHLPAFNNIQAASAADARLMGYTGLIGQCKIKIPVSTIQNWVDGTLPNYGWTLYCDDIPGGNGLQIRSSEHATTSTRPTLIVRYYVPTSGGGGSGQSTQVVKIISSNAIKNGGIFMMGTVKRPLEQTIDNQALNTDITNIESRYSGRFDDYRYYDGDSEL